MRRAALIVGLLAAGAGTDGRAAPSAPPAAVSGKVEELKTILLSRNDNDPRLDFDFNGLTPADKRAFRELYRETRREKRNERGTIVYLLGRNLTAPEDWAFLREVALEPPCLSLSDCSKKPAPGSDEEATGDEVTLAYPSLVALRQAGRAADEEKTRASAKSAGGTSAEKEALALFAAAKSSKTRAVSRTAATLERKLAPR
ncbi:MAG TPA: hypothetical protein VN915_14560 [Elusimicrobiota bacterium]|nr:hypothetical protein [Elusimicrobiota bacterium]